MYSNLFTNSIIGEGESNMSLTMRFPYLLVGYTGDSAVKTLPGC